MAKSKFSQGAGSARKTAALSVRSRPSRMTSDRRTSSIIGRAKRGQNLGEETAQKRHHDSEDEHGARIHDDCASPRIVVPKNEDPGARDSQPSEQPSAEREEVPKPEVSRGPEAQEGFGRSTKSGQRCRLRHHLAMIIDELSSGEQIARDRPFRQAGGDLKIMRRLQKSADPAAGEEKPRTDR